MDRTDAQHAGDPDDPGVGDVPSGDFVPSTIEHEQRDGTTNGADRAGLFFVPPGLEP